MNKTHLTPRSINPHLTGPVPVVPPEERVRKSPSHWAGLKQSLPKPLPAPVPADVPTFPPLCKGCNTLTETCLTGVPSSCSNQVGGAQMLTHVRGSARTWELFSSPGSRPCGGRRCPTVDTWGPGSDRCSVVGVTGKGEGGGGGGVRMARRQGMEKRKRNGNA